jgi:hypothetical protein
MNYACVYATPWTTKLKITALDARHLEKVGLVMRDMENRYLNLPVDHEDSILQLQDVHPD